MSWIKSQFQMLALALLLLTGCAGEVQPVVSEAAETLRPTETALRPETVTPAPVEAATASGSQTLRIWVPPQFDPASGTPAGEVLQARLNQFIKRRPGVAVDVRVKAVSGVGGLLDALSTTSAAAPLAMPDLIALPQELLESAVLKGLLSPYENLENALDGEDWYGYAQELAQIQNSVYGLPFAGDALILVYRPDKIETPPVDWAGTLELAMPLVYPAADPLSLFTLAQYRTSGGDVSDESGGAYLDSEALASVFAYYMEAEAAGVMPFWLTQYQSDEQVWEAFYEDRSDMLVTWGSRFLSQITGEAPNQIVAAPLPTQQAGAGALATGWVWALTSSQAEDQALSVELAEFLTDGGFLSGWTQAAGYLPTRPSAMVSWPDGENVAIFSAILDSALLLPPSDIQSALGLALQQAVVQVLKQQADALTAAQAAAGSLAEP